MMIPSKLGGFSDLVGSTPIPLHAILILNEFAVNKIRLFSKTILAFWSHLAHHLGGSMLRASTFDSEYGCKQVTKTR